MLLHYILLGYLALAAGKTDQNYKDQYCTDPRTLRKHAAYSEWADAYSCSRHRCQPGGRNLAIYTVGCKRVEAPESAIECEEVVEDTNMQFPYCCTRLRCLVVIRGEVWTKVLGQPWETLPAAPWSHMYKMKKPPPNDETLLPKHTEQGPVYELQTDVTEEHKKILRASKSKTLKDPDCKDKVRPIGSAPDIVIALTTGNNEKDVKKIDPLRHKTMKFKTANTPSDDFDKELEVDGDEAPAGEKILETSNEIFISNTFGDTTKTPHKAQNSWSQMSQNQWSDIEPSTNIENSPLSEEKQETSGLQALVDAIGTRMRDIEDVVQRMNEKVVQKPLEHGDSEEKQFSEKNRGSKYLRASEDVTSEHPLYIEDLNGYFSDASNSIIRTEKLEKEPMLTYMAPVENRRKPHTPDSFEVEKKHKKHSHKKKKGKGKGRKRHHGKENTKKHFNKLSSLELDKNLISFEDSSVIYY